MPRFVKIKPNAPKTAIMLPEAIKQKLAKSRPVFIRGEQMSLYCAGKLFFQNFGTVETASWGH